MIGTIIDGSCNIFTVEYENNIISCSLKSKRLKSNIETYNPLSPGDCVEFIQDTLNKNKGQIVTLIDRKNNFIRFNTKQNRIQLLASNLDLLVIVTTPFEPNFKPGFVDRVLIQTQKQNIMPLIVCNKCDLIKNNDYSAFNDSVETWRKIGYNILFTSTIYGNGITNLSNILSGKQVAFVGQSGVGKSSLINALDTTGQTTLTTDTLSKKHKKGKHTTVQGALKHIRLIDKNTASVIDTPGVKNFILCNIKANELILYFPEMAKYFGKCAYGASCTHTNEKNCKIIEALSTKDISIRRYKSYLTLRKELLEMQEKKINLN